jgi:hypothetical protein
MKFVSTILATASGSLAGSVFSRNANGAYIRNRAKPTNNNSTAQQSARALFSTVSTTWQTLTPAQRQSFIDQVENYPYIDKLGQTKTYTGSQLYKKLNGNLIQTGNAIIDNCLPPVTIVAIDSAVGSASQANGVVITGVSFGGVGLIVPDGYVCNVYATRAMGAGVTNPKPPMFRMIAVLPEATDTGDYDISTEYEAVYGDGYKTMPITSTVIWLAFKTVCVTTGQAMTTFVQAKAILGV